MTSAQGDILYINGRTGKYLEPAAGKANWNIFAMARPGLAHRLRGAFVEARREKTTVTLADVVVGTNGGTQTVAVTVQPLAQPEVLREMVLVVFTDVAAAPATPASRPKRSGDRNQRLAQLELELDQARQEARTVREEMQTSQEELRSINEELQSANEELQSTNEELTTSKEELQSMNEELQTVNHELQSKVNDLSRANDDMKNLLDSTDIATLFLDNTLRVRRFTSQMTKITQLIPGDIGRPITDIASDPLYPELADDARQVLQTLVRVERPVAARTGVWYAVRILPYITTNKVIDGVVITYSDITSAKQLEAELHTTEARLRELLAEKS